MLFNLINFIEGSSCLEQPETRNLMWKKTLKNLAETSNHERYSVFNRFKNSLRSSENQLNKQHRKSHADIFEQMDHREILRGF